MNLTVLGSGSSIPHPKRSSSGYWVETGAGTCLLDCSATAPMRMAQEKLDWPNLGAVWISHFHQDHCVGLLPLLSGMKQADEVKERTSPLRIAGPVGLKKLLTEFDRVNSYKLFEQRFPVEICEVSALERFEILPGVEAVAMSTPHTAESHAIHLRDSDSKTLVYSSDTGFDETVATFGNGVDLLILECTFVRDKLVQKHLELAEAMFLIRKANPKLAMLTHFYPEWDEVSFSEEVAKFETNCEVIEAWDGRRLEI